MSLLLRADTGRVGMANSIFVDTGELDRYRRDTARHSPKSDRVVMIKSSNEVRRDTVRCVQSWKITKIVPEPQNCNE